MADSIQWDGGIRSAEACYKFMGKTFEPIWAYQTMVDGKPVFDPMHGGPVLRIPAREGDIWLQPGDWIVKGASAGEFTFVKGLTLPEGVRE